MKKWNLFGQFFTSVFTFCFFCFVKAKSHGNFICGSTISQKAQGVLESPNYPLSYPPNISCLWIILANPGEVILLQIIDIDLELNSKTRHCSFDYLEIKGIKGIEGGVTRICREYPDNLESAKNSVKIRFKSDASTERPGFRLAFYVVQEKTKLLETSSPQTTLPSTTTTATTTEATTQEDTTAIKTTALIRNTKTVFSKTIPTFTRKPTTITTQKKNLVEVTESLKILIQDKVQTWLVITAVIIGTCIIPTNRFPSEEKSWGELPMNALIGVSVVLGGLVTLLIIFWIIVSCCESQRSSQQRCASSARSDDVTCCSCDHTLGSQKSSQASSGRCLNRDAMTSQCCLRHHRRLHPRLRYSCTSCSDVSSTRDLIKSRDRRRRRRGRHAVASITSSSSSARRCNPLMICRCGRYFNPRLIPRAKWDLKRQIRGSSNTAESDERVMTSSKVSEKTNDDVTDDYYLCRIPKPPPVSF